MAQPGGGGAAMDGNVLAIVIAATVSTSVFIVAVLILLLLLYHRDPMCCQFLCSCRFFQTPGQCDCPPPYFSSSQRLVGPQRGASRLESAAENPGMQGDELFCVGPPSSYRLPSWEQPRLPSYESVRKKDRQREIHQMIAKRCHLLTSMLYGILQLSQEQQLSQRPQTDVVHQTLSRPRSATKLSETQLCEALASPCSSFPWWQRWKCLGHRSHLQGTAKPQTFTLISDQLREMQATQTQPVEVSVPQHEDNHGANTEHRALPGVTRDIYLLFSLAHALLPKATDRLLYPAEGQSKDGALAEQTFSRQPVYRTSVRLRQAPPSTPSVRPQVVVLCHFTFSLGYKTVYQRIRYQAGI